MPGCGVTESVVVLQKTEDIDLRYSQSRNTGKNDLCDWRELKLHSEYDKRDKEQKGKSMRQTRIIA